MRYGNSDPVNNYLHNGGPGGRVLHCDRRYLRNIVVINLIENPFFDHDIQEANTLGETRSKREASSSSSYNVHPRLLIRT